MKKMLIITLVFILVLSLAACDSTSGGEIKEPSVVTTASSTEEAEATISESVLVDEAGVRITVKSLEKDAFFGPEVKLLIENNSGKDLTFQCSNTSINGYMVESMMSVDVVNGKKANASLTFLETDLDACGVEEIADIEIAFRIFDMVTWEDYLNTDAIQIKTAIADTFEYTYHDSGNLAYEGNDLKIVIKGLAEEESILGPGILVYIENTGDKDITVQTRNISINGFMVEGIFSCEVVAGKRAVDMITFMESELEENEITAIEAVELSFYVFDMNTWEDIVETEAIKITF